MKYFAYITGLAYAILALAAAEPLSRVQRSPDPIAAPEPDPYGGGWGHGPHHVLHHDYHHDYHHGLHHDHWGYGGYGHGGYWDW